MNFVFLSLQIGLLSSSAPFSLHVLLHQGNLSGFLGIVQKGFQLRFFSK